MAYKMRKREEGTCRICTKDARPGGIRCWEHYDQNLEDKRAYRQRLKEEGRCTRCGNEMCRGCNGDDPKWMR